MSAGLRVLAQVQAARPQAAAQERCDLCGVPIADTHGHVVDLASRALRCTCRACYLLFDYDDASLSHRAVPDRYLSFPDLLFSPGQWDELGLPVSMVFLFENSQQERVVAFYPSPAGATESELPLDAWQAVLDANPALSTARPDVEALLLRAQGQEIECWLVPIDICYELVGTLRMSWHGFDGGQDVRREIEDFFARVQDRARPA